MFQSRFLNEKTGGKQVVRKLTRRQLLSSALVAAAGTALAACAGAAPAEPTKAPAAAPATSAPAGATPAAAPKTGSSFAGKKITFWQQSMSDKQRAEVLQKMFETFKAETGATVETVTNTWGDRQQKYLTAIESKTTPDLGEETWITPVGFGKMGAVVPITDVAKEIGEFQDGPASGVRTPDGKWWGMPWFMDVRGMWYWEDLFADKGVKTPFETWDDWLVGLKTVTKGDFYGIALRGKGWGHWTSVLAIANGGARIDKDGNIVMNKPPAVEALKFWTDLYLVHKVTPPGTPAFTEPDMQALFAKRQVASNLNHAGSANQAKQENPQLEEKLRFQWVPPSKAWKEKGGTGWNQQGGSTMILFSSAKDPDVGRALMKFLLREDNYKPWTTLQPNLLPVLKSRMSDPFYTKPTWMKEMIGNIPYTSYHGSHLSGALEELGLAEGARIYAEADEDVLAGNLNPQQALDRAQKKMEELRAQLKTR